MEYAFRKWWQGTVNGAPGQALIAYGAFVAGWMAAKEIVGERQVKPQDDKEEGR